MDQKKTDRLDTLLTGLSPFVVAFSGGLDSSYLVYKVIWISQFNEDPFTHIYLVKLIKEFYVFKFYLTAFRYWHYDIVFSLYQAFNIVIWSI